MRFAAGSAGIGMWCPRTGVKGGAEGEKWCDCCCDGGMDEGLTGTLLQWQRSSLSLSLQPLLFPLLILLSVKKLLLRVELDRPQYMNIEVELNTLRVCEGRHENEMDDEWGSQS